VVLRCQHAAESPTRFLKTKTIQSHPIALAGEEWPENVMSDGFPGDPNATGLEATLRGPMGKLGAFMLE
jgi:hypothetical protein